jgi:hypothetical protein
MSRGLETAAANLARVTDIVVPRFRNPEPLATDVATRLETAAASIDQAQVLAKSFSGTAASLLGEAATQTRGVRETLTQGHLGHGEIRQQLLSLEDQLTPVRAAVASATGDVRASSAFAADSSSQVSAWNTWTAFVEQRGDSVVGNQVLDLNR